MLSGRRSYVSCENFLLPLFQCTDFRYGWRSDNNKIKKIFPFLLDQKLNFHSHFPSVLSSERKCLKKLIINKKKLN
jgi:hypothetical protein